MSSYKLSSRILAWMPIAIFLGAWEVHSRHSSAAAFFFSTPSAIASSLLENSVSGMLPLDFLYTALPVFAGFLCSALVGTAVGLFLALSPSRSRSARAYIEVIANVPAFAIAPMMIVWFGIGLKMKIALAIFSSIFVAFAQAYEGAMAVSGRHRQVLQGYGATSWQIVRHLFLPSSLSRILGGLRITSGLALFGTIIGEFMASDHGLAHRMLKAGSLYDVSLVLACAAWMIALVLLLNAITRLFERSRLPIVQFLSVSPGLWTKRPLTLPEG